ncbi:MAG TPA: hypothetical protein VFV10_00610 [Gammaproteobacteria bacterium]|nr:hypothetical protein [Gammaproteobacteria bacterium]
MQVLGLIVIGLLLVGGFVAAGRYANRRSAMQINGAFIFIVCWTAFTLGHFIARIFNPETAPLVELGKHLAVFVVPVAAALAVSRKAA